jgi:hypothetical protein
LVSPNAEPALIQSIQDLSNLSKIHLLVNAGNGFDISLSVSFRVLPYKIAQRICNLNKMLHIHGAFRQALTQSATFTTI